MSGRRVALGVAFKNARRNKKRTFYLVLLIAVPVMVAVVTSAVVRLGHISVEEHTAYQFGGTNVLLFTRDLPPDAESWLESEIERLAPGSQRLAYRDNWMRFTSDAGGQVLDLDLSDPLAEGQLTLAEGRVPFERDETVITEHAASLLDVSIGDTVELGRRQKATFEVVGLTSHPVLWRINSAVVTTEGFDRVFPSTFQETVLLAVPDDMVFTESLGRSWDEARFQFYPGDVEWPKPEELWFVPDEYWPHLSDDQIAEAIRQSLGGTAPAAAEEYIYSLGIEIQEPIPNLHAESRSQQLLWNNESLVQQGPVVGTGVAALILAEVGFIAAAAFATGARRRLREIGLMSANGADVRHVRASVLGEGLVVGVAGGMFGSMLAFFLMVLGRPVVQRFVERRIDDFPFTIADMAGPLVVAVLACILAAWLPSRTISAVPTLTALQGRMPVTAPKTWVLPVGFGFAGLGSLLLGVGLASQSTRGGAVAVFGAVLMIGGVAMLAGPLVAWIAEHADRFSVTPRIVLRDSGRQRGKAAAAVAATMVILMAPVAALATNAQYEALELTDGLRSDHPQMVVSGGFDEDVGDVDLTTEDISQIRAAMPDAKVAAFDVLGVVAELPGHLEAKLRTDVDDFIEPPRWQVAIVNDELKQLLADPRVDEMLERDGVMLIGVSERQSTISLDGASVSVSEVPIGVARYSFPRVIVTEDYADRFGDTLRRPMAVIQVEQTLAESLFGSPFEPLWVSDLHLQLSGGRGGSPQVVVAITFLLTTIVVLIVVATITALSAAEGDRDLETIVAVGATNAIRRKYLGLQSGIHTFLGALLSVPLTLLVMWTVYSAGNTAYIQARNFAIWDSSQLFIPWNWIALLLVGLPLVIGLITFLGVRSAPTTPPRRAT